MEPPTLHRQISHNITKQYYEDCWAHALTRVVIKSFRKIMPEHFGLTNETCLDRYEDPRKFYSPDGRMKNGEVVYCTSDVCATVTLTELQGSCSNQNEINSLNEKL